MAYRAPDWVPDSAAKNAHAMKVAGGFDDGDGKIDDKEWTAYQQSLGNTWTKEEGWSNKGQPSHQAAASRASSHTSNKKLPDINTYNRTAYGSGSHKGTDKLSAHDLKRLESYGYGLQEIVDYAEKSYAEGSKGGGKADSVLNKFKDRLKNQSSQVAYTPPPAPTPSPTPAFTPAKQDGGSGFTPGQKFDLVKGVLDTGNNDQITGASGSGTNISKVNTQVAVDTGDIDVRNSTVSGSLVTGNQFTDNSLTATSGEKFLENFMDGVAPSIDDGESSDLEVPALTPVGPGTSISSENTQTAADTGDISAVNSYIGGDLVTGTQLTDNSLTITSYGGGGKGPGFNNMQSMLLYNALDDRDNRIRIDEGRTGDRFAGDVLKKVDVEFKPQDNIDNYYDAVTKSLSNNNAQATNMTSLLFGDLWNPNMTGIDWKVPNPTKKPEIDYTKPDEIMSKIS